MKTVHEIAQGLAIEIKDRFGIETTVVGGMHYDLKKDKSGSMPKATEDFLNSWAVQHDKFSLTVTTDQLCLSIISEDAKKWSGKVEGLPGVMLKTMVDPKPKSHHYLLTDPTSVNSMLDKLEEILKNDPVAER